LDKQGVKRLQAQGIKVVLSILPKRPEKGKEKEAVGWSTMDGNDNASLVRQLGMFIKEYNFNGIDIDDEFGPAFPGNGVENFYNTVSAIRKAFPEPFVISNVVYLGSEWGDLEKYYKYPMRTDDKQPKGLADLMSYVSTMSYGNDCKYITDEVKQFSEKLGDKGEKIPIIPMKKLYAGVAPGPVDSEGKICAELRPGETKYTPAWTTIKVAEDVAKWAKSNCAGVMLYSYSTDTVEYTGDRSGKFGPGCPRPSEESGPKDDPRHWPNKDDHAWQKAITKVLQ
jgi:hypothetical protein